MSQTDQLLMLFREHGNRLTLGEMLDNWRRIGSNETGRISDLRRAGYIIECKEDRDLPTANLYILRDPVKVEADGQRCFA